jgi:FMN reductase
MLVFSTGTVQIEASQSAQRRNGASLEVFQMRGNSKLLMIVGAATPPGRLAAAISVTAELAQSKHPDTTVEILNLAEAPIETCDGRSRAAYGNATRQAVAQIVSAAAVLMGVPVYRASFPGVLKNLLDIVPVEALQDKPVGIVAMGGSPHHYLAADTQLRQVLAWFGALLAPDSALAVALPAAACQRG